MPRRFLHEHAEFKTLLEIVSEEKEIHAPPLVEKDYWIMHVLWGLAEQGFQFELKGGTSLSKGYRLIHRFSEDIDIQIHPPDGMEVHVGENKNKASHIESRRRYFDWLARKIELPGITSVMRDQEFDDTEKCRNAGIRLAYESHFDTVAGLKDGILLEVGFDQTQPNEGLLLSSWAYDHGAPQLGEITDNRATQVACYRPEYTFVEKIQTVIRKFRKFEQEGKVTPNFLRHYYDIYMLLGDSNVRAFIGTSSYLTHKEKRIRGADRAFEIARAFDVLQPKLEAEYRRTKGLYYRGQIPLTEIVARIQPFLSRL